MADLHPASFLDLLDRIHLEFEQQNAIFDFPRRKWYQPDPAGPDLSVLFHGQPAATPVGPASGPHNQLAQNLILSWLAGSRIIELKTVQINDHLTISRPCIDAANVCYNVEWSQELTLEQSLQEYVAGTMLIHLLRCGNFFPGIDMAGPLGATLYDMSVGYDLAGIQSKPVTAFIRGMKNATAVIDRLRSRIPARYRRLRDLDYPTSISDSITLSTFHGCPADEIERICLFLLSEMDVNIIVKMNPPMLGQPELERLLHEVMGFTEIQVPPSAYSATLQFDEAVAMCRRLAGVAARMGRSFGAKFSNTLEVVNHRRRFTADNRTMYLSGPPLHVITLTLAEQFRQAVGPAFPISFSAGVDQDNFADMVATGCVPVTTCTDLLKPGGYGRLPKYLANLIEAMSGVSARCIGDFILDAFGQRETAGEDVDRAATANMSIVADRARNDDRYRSSNHRSEPKRTGGQLVIFDCLTCDKCISVCPNDANFAYHLAPRRLTLTNWKVDRDGELKAEPAEELVISRKHQIANFADFCNQCGNCDTFCPEYGGPFIEKPSFFGNLATWRKHRERDGLVIEHKSLLWLIHGRFKGREYHLEHDTATGRWLFDDSTLTVRFDKPADWTAETGKPVKMTPPVAGHIIDMRVFHTMRLLFEAMTDKRWVYPVNVRWLAEDTRQQA